jgi:hypothetical protein
MADELASLLEITAPSSRFFRRLERTLFHHSEGEDTGTVLARFDPLVGETLADRYGEIGVYGSVSKCMGAAPLDWGPGGRE